MARVASGDESSAYKSGSDWGESRVKALPSAARNSRLSSLNEATVLISGDALILRSSASERCEVK